MAAVLKLDGIEIVRKASTDPDKAREIFEALAARFNWHKSVTDYIVDVMELTTLTEFICVFHTPPNGDVDKIHEL